MNLSCFDFPLPSELIAQRPAGIRDRSKLMVVDRRSGKIHEAEFRDIIHYLFPNDLIVLNNTKVFPSRIYGEKEETGGKIEVLLVEKKEGKEWISLIKGKVKVGQRLIFAKKRLSAIVIDQEGAGKWLIRFETDEDLLDIMNKYGQTPLPPYIKRDTPLSYDKIRYQTVYAKQTGAVAAPTAGLHFTKNLIKKIMEKGVEIVFVTLHVGPGTFRPVKTADINNHKMDKEAYSVSEEAVEKINKAKKSGRRVIAIGTTTTRVLETIYLKGIPKISGIEGYTDLFITPGFRFKAVDALVTNFHLPRSTLLILVSAFSGYDLIMKTYKMAVEKGYRFYSYGDAMFII